MKLDPGAILMYLTGIGVLIYMFSHPDSVVKFVSGLLNSFGTYIGQVANA